MGGFSGSSSSGGSGRGRTDAGANRSTASRVGVGNINERGQKTSSRSGGGNAIVNFIKGGGITGAVIRGVSKKIGEVKEQSRRNKLTSSFDSEEGVKPTYTPPDNGRDDNPQGIELAKQSTTSATILGPAEIQKEAANNVKGPTTTEMSADQILLGNKRKGRRSTNITAKKTLANNYTLSKKSLLG